MTSASPIDRTLHYGNDSVAPTDTLMVWLDRLIASRMLIVANSGGGKSRALRSLLEETAGHVQQIVFDLEGEFVTLRELSPILVAGDGGDIPAHPDQARALCRQLMTISASCVINLYDLKPQDRRRYVRLFLEELMALPREHWHPCLVVLDEAHTLAPERGVGEAESTDAVVTLCTQGRKRGYCAVGVRYRSLAGSLYIRTANALDAAIATLRQEYAVLVHELDSDADPMQPAGRALRDVTEIIVPGNSAASQAFTALLTNGTIEPLEHDEDQGDVSDIVEASNAYATLAKSFARIPYRPVPRPRSSSHEKLSGTMIRMCSALLQLEALGMPTATRHQVAMWCGISHTSGSFSNNLSTLRKAGLIEDVDRESIRLTEAGRATSDGSAVAIGSRSHLHALWMNKVGGTPAKMLRALIDAYPRAIARADLASADLASAVGVSPTSGSWSNNLSTLRTMGLLEDVDRQHVRAHAVLFPRGLPR